MPRISLSLKIFFVYALFVCLSGYFVARAVMDEIRPGVRQSTEETLVDTANLLAEILAEPLYEQRLGDAKWQTLLKNYNNQSPDVL